MRLRCIGCMAASTRAHATPVEEATLLNYGNCVARAMPGILRELPWAAGGRYRVGEVLCETFWISPFRNGTHQDACPRYMARKQLERLAGKGYALYSAFEPEFMVFNRGTLTPVIDGMDIFSSLRLAQVEEYACSLDDYLTKSGVHSSGFLVEHGSGQMEFSLDPSFGVESADQMFWFKQTVKELTLKPSLLPASSEDDDPRREGDSPSPRNWQATFMAQPFPEASNNGLHFNHSLWSIDGKQNLFADPSDPDGLSVVARHWVAGLVKHARALSAICCPTVNCYRRLFTPWAPEKANWGIDDRFSSFRVKSQDVTATYVENRLPSGAANPYLVLAATVAAGLDGIANRLECPPERLEFTDAVDLPRTLTEALKALQEDSVIVKALSEEFINWFVKVKVDLEVAPTDCLELDSVARIAKEREFYFELL